MAHLKNSTEGAKMTLMAVNVLKIIIFSQFSNGIAVG